MQLYFLGFYFKNFTCFGHLPFHHQEYTTASSIVGITYERWIMKCTVLNHPEQSYRTLHFMIQRSCYTNDCRCSSVLMMRDMVNARNMYSSWNKSQDNVVASCWIYLRILKYDAQNGEPKNVTTCLLHTLMYTATHIIFVLCQLLVTILSVRNGLVCIGTSVFRMFSKYHIFVDVLTLPICFQHFTFRSVYGNGILQLWRPLCLIVGCSLRSGQLQILPAH
jgi:hypothetical protein